MTPHPRPSMRSAGLALASIVLLLACALSACHRGPPGPGHIVPPPGHLKH